MKHYDPLAPITHETLAQLLPFYCCWLDDGEGEPCNASVVLGPILFASASTSSFKIGENKGKPWKN